MPKYKFEHFISDDGTHKIKLIDEHNNIHQGNESNYSFPATYILNGNIYVAYTDAWKGMFPTETVMQLLPVTEIESPKDLFN